jgi:murein DD-endopeptidase MepM/ murein hydrolase activator NlpD
MKQAVRHGALVGTACAVLVLGSSSSPPSFALHAASRSNVAADVATDAVSAGERWFHGAREALDGAAEIDMPFADLTGADGRATAFSFDALAGQILEIAVESAGDRAAGVDAATVDAATVDAATVDAAAEGAIYIDVFRVVDVLGRGLHERLTALRPGSQTLRTRLPSDGTYHVLVQAERPAVTPRRFTLELGAALPFPVVGGDEGAIRSLFGATRDAGRRNHQGVDIFVQRLTPVLAVASGRAMPAKDALGGNTVWLNTAGTSYYYAHLDRVAVRDGQQVKVGDVLGYVGNTGNARNVPSHLHFGVFRWGKKPIDPLPLLVGHRFARGARERLAADAGG